MCAMEAKGRDDGKQKMDSNPIIENKTPVEGKGKSKKLFLFGGLALFLLIAGGGGFWAYKHFRSNKGLPGDKAKLAKEAQHPKVKDVLGLEPFLVNLADADEVRFLKATFQLGMEEELKEESKEASETPAIRDSIISLLSSKTADQILTIQGKDKLREEIRARINAIASENKVIEVYIVDFVVQL
jgi:flagellar protein FliL